MQVSLAQVKAITNHTVSQAFVSWLPSSRFDVRDLVAAQMDLELLRLRRTHMVSLFLRKTLCKTPHRHSTSNFFWLMFALPRRCTLLSSSASFLRRRRPVSRLTQWSPQLLVSLLNSFFTLREHRMLPRRTGCPRQCVVCAPEV